MPTEPQTALSKRERDVTPDAQDSWADAVAAKRQSSSRGASTSTPRSASSRPPWRRSTPSSPRSSTPSASPTTRSPASRRSGSGRAATTRPRRRGRGWRCLVSSSRKPVLEGSLRALDGCGGVIGRPARGRCKFGASPAPIVFACHAPLAQHPGRDENSRTRPGHEALQLNSDGGLRECVHGADIQQHQNRCSNTTSAAR